MFQLKKNIRPSHTLTIVKVITLAIGILLMQIHILGLRYYESEIIPTVMFLVGASLVSLSLTLLWDSHGHRQKPLLLIALVFIVAFSLIKIPTSRFTFIPGGDLLGEYYAAEKTSISQKWPPEIPISSIGRLRTGRYKFFWTTSVTILPSTIFQITGLPMLCIFEVIYPLISAIVPVLIFLFTRQVFNTRIATLSSVIFIISSIYVQFFNLMRENLAIVCLLLSLLCLSKSVKNKDLRFRFLALILAFTTVTFHYVIGDFAMLTFLVFWLSPKLHIAFSKIRNLKYLRRFFQTEWKHTTIITPTFFLFLVVSAFAWFLLATPLIWPHVRVVHNALRALTRPTPPLRHISVSRVWISPQGLYHTTISNLTKVLIALGFFIALKTSNTSQKLSLTMLGGAGLAVLVGWTVMPWLSIELHPVRVYAICFLIFSTFIALSLTKLSSKLPRWKLLLLTFLVTIIFLDGILTMPLIYWHAKGSLDAKDVMMVPNRGSSLITLGKWIDENVEKQNVLLADFYTIDVKVFAEIQVSARDIFEFVNASNPSMFAISAQYRYIVVSSWLQKGHISFIEKTTNEKVVLTLDEEKIQLLYNDFNIVYCNENYSLFHLPTSPTG